MPMHPRRPCRELYCPHVAVGTTGYCEKHQPESKWGESKNPDYKKQGGYDKRHQLLRKAAFHRDNGLCQLCLRQGKYTPATIAHHIKPMIEYPELKYNLDNITSVCRPCHEIIHGRRRR